LRFFLTIFTSLISSCGFMYLIGLNDTEKERLNGFIKINKTKILPRRCYGHKR
jgi:hypothetical protein